MNFFKKNFRLLIDLVGFFYCQPDFDVASLKNSGIKKYISNIMAIFVWPSYVWYNYMTYILIYFFADSAIFYCPLIAVSLKEFFLKKLGCLNSFLKMYWNLDT